MTEGVTLERNPPFQIINHSQEYYDDIKLDELKYKIECEFEDMRLKAKNVDPITKTKVIMIINRCEKLLLGD